MTDKRLIVALDFNNSEDVKNLINKLGDCVSFYKVGMELFYSVGASIIDWLKSREKKIFLDLKLHDIPSTVSGGLCSLMKLGVDILNVHASGGFSMMKLAAEQLHESAYKLNVNCPKLIAVTILTSINQTEWTKLGNATIISNQIIQLSKLAQKAKLDGVVSSAHEVEMIRKVCGQNFLIVTPGIRPSNSIVNDQSRTATPKMALMNGANLLVIGRPISTALNPREAAEKILMEMAEIPNG